MRLPHQSPAVTRGISIAPITETLTPSGCSVFKKVGCATAIAACGAVCFASLGSACVQCLAGIGASGCIDCF
jgi:hypothetical protein